MGCSVAAEGQIVVDYEDEFDEFGDAKCSLCQRRFEEQGKILPFDMNGISYKKNKKKRDDIRKKKRRPRERDLDKLWKGERERERQDQAYQLMRQA